MADITSGFINLNPSYTLPQQIIQFQQPSGAFLALPEANITPQLSSTDLAVYVNRLNVKSQYLVSQNIAQDLPSCVIDSSQISIPTYILRTRAIYDHHDTAMASVRGFSLQDAQRRAMRQGIFQGLRQGLLYGFNPQNAGEGLLNTPGAVTVNLPPDSKGETSVIRYDAGEMAQFLIQQIVLAKSRMNQIGIPARVVIVAPQRIVGQWEYTVVQLTSYQRAGAGSASVAQTAGQIAGWNGDTIEFGLDDTLEGRGAGGTDAVLLVFPEVKVPYFMEPNTNEFGKLQPGLDATTLMLTDMAAPREIPVPIPGGALDIVSEMRATPGWGVRSQGTTVISMQYSPV